MCMIHIMDSAKLIKILEAHGWTVGRIKGSHHQMVKGGRAIPVPHPKKDLGIGLVNSILKRAGIK